MMTASYDNWLFFCRCAYFYDPKHVETQEQMHTVTSKMDENIEETVKNQSIFESIQQSIAHLKEEVQSQTDYKEQFAQLIQDKNRVTQNLANLF
jgi:methyl-accepting chemotaxis protein